MIATIREGAATDVAFDRAGRLLAIACGTRTSLWDIADRAHPQLRCRLIASYDRTHVVLDPFDEQRGLVGLLR